jgi:glycosyltransferase involved in cell wall biosynthesis
MNPLVSIIIPVFNRCQLIEETLLSIINQTYSNWECIVIDDGSSDNTWDVLLKYSIGDNRIKIFKRDRKPKGAPTCRNIGMDYAKGDYLMFMDSDDLMGNNCLAFRIQHVNLHPKGLCYIFATKIFHEHIGDTNKYWNKLKTSTPDIIRFLNFDTPWHTSGAFWSRKEKMPLVKFDETAESMQDWEMHIRNILSGLNYIKIEDYDEANITHYRIDRSIESISRNHYSKEKLEKRLQILEKVIDELTMSIGDKETLQALNRMILRLTLMFANAKLEKGVLSFKSKFIWKLEKNIAVRWLIKKFFDKKIENKSTKWIQIFLCRVFNKKYLFKIEDAGLFQKYTMSQS